MTSLPVALGATGVNKPHIDTTAISTQTNKITIRFMAVLLITMVAFKTSQSHTEKLYKEDVTQNVRIIWLQIH